VSISLHINLLLQKKHKFSYIFYYDDILKKQLALLQIKAARLLFSKLFKTEANKANIPIHPKNEVRDHLFENVFKKTVGFKMHNLKHYNVKNA